jgi:hypothetical protein
MLSSALGEREEKLSHASYKIAEGEVDPGRKIDKVDAEIDVQFHLKDNEGLRTRHFL